MLSTASFCFRMIGKVFVSCSDWLVDNKLSLHIGKTECIIFGSKSKLIKVDELSDLQ